MYQCPLDMFSYTIEPGDTLQKIAERFNTTVKLMIKENYGLNPNSIYVGQHICIPSCLTHIYYKMDVNTDDGYSKQEVNLINDLRELWGQHVAWTRMIILSISENLDDIEIVTNRILRNSTDFGMLMREFYSADIADEYNKLIRNHLVIAAELVKAAKMGDNEKAAELEKAWYENADEIAVFMAKINPYWSEKDWKEMLYKHLAQTKLEAVDRINKNYASDVKIYDEIEDHAMKMADTMSEGIIRQFPKMF